MRHTHDLAAAWPATGGSEGRNAGQSFSYGAQKAIFTSEVQPFHLIAYGVPAFEGLPPRQYFLFRCDKVP
jgi:hypothetical protein